MRRRAAGLFLAVLVASGCGALPRQAARSSPTAASVATPVPWIRATPASLLLPTPTPTPVPAGTAACRGIDLAVVFGGIGALTGGQLAATVLFGNRSARACVLEGVPAVQLFDGSGRRLQISNSPAEGMPSNPVLVLPGTADVQAHVARAGVGYVEMDWATHDGAGNACIPTPPRATAVAVVLPAGDATPRVAVSDSMSRWSSVAPCYSRLSVSAFQSFDVPEASPSPNPLSYLTVGLDAPSSVAAGSILYYTVTLSNSSSQTFQFPSECPSYIEWGADSTAAFGKEVHVLNCTPVALIAPAQSVRFAMEIQVAAGTAPGKYALRWQFIPPIGLSISNASVDVTVL